MNKTPDNDYIQAFMTERAPNFSRAALVIVDMQYATGHRDGALGRRLAAEGSKAWREQWCGTVRKRVRCVEAGRTRRARGEVFTEVGPGPEEHDAAGA